MQQTLRALAKWTQIVNSLVQTEGTAHLHQLVFGIRQPSLQESLSDSALIAQEYPHRLLRIKTSSFVGL